MVNASPMPLLRYFSPEELAGIDLNKVPRHIAIMMDGNRRWARKSLYKILDGHINGAEIVPDILKSAKELGVQVMTLYTFSTENWNRSPEEVEILMRIFVTYIKKHIPEMVACGIRFDTIGDITSFPQAVQMAVAEAKEATLHCKDLLAIYAMNYGGRNEMKRAIQKIACRIKEGDLEPSEITEETVAQFLDTVSYGDPDLLIRTSGEHRMSNFLLWQISYSEIYFTDTLWPDFTPKTLLEAIYTYQQRERRFGA